MIKARNYLFLAAAATLLLAGCQNGLEEESKGSSNVVTIRCNAGSPSSSRIASYSTEFDQAHWFEAGDQVCVSTDGQDPVVYQCTDADQQTWTEADSSKFLLWTDSEMTFKAYYPATEGTSMTSFTLPADQSTTGKIALADYMTRQQTGSNEYGNDINLNLERKMARVIVNIAGFTDQYDNNEKTVSNVRIYSEASGIEYDNPTGSSAEITPYAQGDGGAGTSYTALVVPGYGDEGATFIQLTDGEGSTLTVKGIPELEEGCSYTFNLTVGKNTIQVQSVTVTDWTGATLTGGQATEQGAKAPATVTTAPTGAAIVGVGKSTALVSGGAADGGTLMYAVTTTNTKPTSTDGFSASVPTAQTITASGKVYVWYYVKADDTHTDSEIAATAIEVPVADIVWDGTNLSDFYLMGNYDPCTIDGVTLSGNAEQVYARWNDYGDPKTAGISFEAMESGGFTFTAPTGKKFTKIEMKLKGPAGWDFANLGTGWTLVENVMENDMIFTVTWKDSAAASKVDLLKDAGNFNGEYAKYIAFYLSE